MYKNEEIFSYNEDWMSFYVIDISVSKYDMLSCFFFLNLSVNLVQYSVEHGFLELFWE